MSSNKTEKLGLHSWVRTDAFRMDEFNENFDKIDKAVGDNAAALEGKADAGTVSALQSAVEGKAEATALAVKAELVFGTYEGDSQATRVIDLGFTPKAVYVCRENGTTTYQANNLTTIYGGLALQDHPVTQGTALPAVTIVDGGFQVCYRSSTSYYVNANHTGVIYHYIAFK